MGKRSRPTVSGLPTEGRRLVLGWTALSLGVVACSFWAFWGTNEAFHEGWWAATLGGRLLQTAMYHAPLLICLALCLLAVLAPRAGAVAFFVCGAAFSVLIFRERWGRLDLAAFLSWVPVTFLVAGVGVLWWFGRARPRRLALAVALGVPLAVSAVCAVEPVLRIAARDPQARLEEVRVPGNGVELSWAPPGPGWVRDVVHACDWSEATRIAAHLAADGRSVLAEPQGLWRLPTAEELAASMTRGGGNAGGTWDAAALRASYRRTPDKEPPLWDPLAETIYWWTATEDGPGRAVFFTYAGRAVSALKTRRMGSHGFRAVRAE